VATVIDEFESHSISNMKKNLAVIVPSLKYELVAAGFGNQ
jgi:hypothetical protein